MAQIDIPLVRSRFAQTSRRDNWWIQPIAVFLGLSTLSFTPRGLRCKDSTTGLVPTSLRFIHPSCLAIPSDPGLA